MSTDVPTRRPVRQLGLLAALLLSNGLASPILAQGTGVGGLTATIVDERGGRMDEVTVTLERGGAPVRVVTTTRSGVARFGVLQPGQYAVLAEQFGYQPVRMRGVAVIGGGSTAISFTLKRQPPPITSVTEVVSNAVVNGSGETVGVAGTDLRVLARTHDVTTVTRSDPNAVVPMDARLGMVEAANGLRPAYSSLIVDGLREALWRHPGIPSEPATAPLFGRDGIDHVSFHDFADASAWPVTLGGALNAATASGNGHFTFRPWGTYSSAKLGGQALDNPGDSTTTSIQAGFAMGGAVKGDTGAWSVRADYQQLELPSAAPFTLGVTTSDSNGNIPAAVIGAAHTLGNRDVSSWLAPTVRTWKGGSGSGRVDWRLSPATLLAIRAGGASWKETNPQVGAEATSGAGSQLAAHDVSAAATITTGSDSWTSETRLGGHGSTRNWTAAPLPFTSIVGDAIAFGSAANLAGDFSETSLQFSEALTFRTGSHALRIGLGGEHRTVTYDYLPGSVGEYSFGDLATFAAGRGAFYQATRSGAAPDLGVSLLSASIDDAWRATPSLQIGFGIRLDHETLPTDAIAANVAWETASDRVNNAVPTDKTSRDLGPHASFALDASGDGRTTLRGAVAMMSGEYDLLALSQVAQSDDVQVRRATGPLAWPAIGAAPAGTTAIQALSLYAPDVRKPRDFKADVALVQRVGAGTTITIGGGYRHGDYLLQSTDLNRVVGALSTDANGRPIYGTLQQYGALLTPAVGSNTRFTDFDHAYGLSSTGYNDYYDATFTIEHQLSRRMSLLLGYVWSKTTDNLPGELSADPADRLSPFPDGLSGARWEDGRSDLDIPSRASATIRYTAPGATAFTIAARYRYQSGLPFTPGFRTGVDANGDGSGGNDPAFVSSTTTGMAPVIAAHSCLATQTGQFAARNSCRDGAVQALDISASIRIVHDLALTVDGFNLAGTATGLYDHALVLVDPKGTITTDAAGHTVLPLIANPSFGTLLSRRADARVLRIGFRVEN